MSFTLKNVKCVYLQDQDSTAFETLNSNVTTVFSDPGNVGPGAELFREKQKL